MATEGETIEVFLRVADLGDVIYYDLAREDDNGDEQFVRVDADGWELVDKVPVYFRRTELLAAQVVPERGGNIDELRRFVNLDDAQFPLYLAFLAAAYRRRPNVLPELVGEQGTAKTSTMTAGVDLVDPAALKEPHVPRNTDDLYVGCLLYTSDAADD